MSTSIPVALTPQEEALLEALRDASPITITPAELHRRLPTFGVEEFLRTIDRLVRHRLAAWWHVRNGSYVILTSLGAERMGVVMVGPAGQSRWESWQSAAESE